jgi:predicted Zn-dependent protease
MKIPPSGNIEMAHTNVYRARESTVLLTMMECFCMCPSQPNPSLGWKGGPVVSLVLVGLLLSSAAYAKDSRGRMDGLGVAQGQSACQDQQTTMPGVRRGSVNDVSAVGDRKIGGRGLSNWYSTSTEMGWGAHYSQEVEKTAKIIQDPVIEEYVNRIGQNIVKNSDAKVPFTIKVIDTDEINAFALPGGFFYVNSGLIMAADNEAELAGVMAHEIAHVAAHHQAREMTRMNYANIGTVPLIMMTGYSMNGYMLYEAASVAIPMTFLQFQRDFEEQADWLGIQYMYRAGYDPQEFIAFFEKIEALEKQKPGILSKAFSTHPQTPARVARSQREIATILPPRCEYVVDTSEFHDVKARLARLENKRKLQNGKGANQPTMRRVGAGNSNGPPSTQTGSDRPTLGPRSD